MISKFESIGGKQPENFAQFLQQQALPWLQCLGYDPFDSEAVAIHEDHILLPTLELTLGWNKQPQTGKYRLTWTGAMLALTNAELDKAIRLDVTDLSEAHALVTALHPQADAAQEKLDEILSDAGWADEIVAYLDQQLETPSKSLLNFLSTTIRKEPIKAKQQAALASGLQEGLKRFVQKHIPPPEKPLEEQILDAIRTLCAAKLEDGDRLVARVNKTYTSVLLDDNNRKPLLRVYASEGKISGIGIMEGNQEKRREKLTDLQNLDTLSEPLLEQLMKLLNTEHTEHE